MKMKKRKYRHQLLLYEKSVEYLISNSNKPSACNLVDRKAQRSKITFLVGGGSGGNSGWCLNTEQ
jgi:hypothetical protein